MKLSTAYIPRIYEFFFTILTGTKKNDLFTHHEKVKNVPPEGYEGNELQALCEKWAKEKHNREPNKKWKFHRRTNKTIEYKNTLKDGYTLMLTIQLIP